MRITVLLILILILILPIVSSFSTDVPDMNKEPLLKADKVLVYKAQRKLHLINNGKIFRTYSIALGDNPVGHKQKKGDERTPEGNYLLDWRNAKSICYKSIHISYPNKQDRENAQKLGVSPGGDVMIHGILNGYAWVGKNTFSMIGQMDA